MKGLAVIINNFEFQSENLINFPGEGEDCRFLHRTLESEGITEISFIYENLKKEAMEKALISAKNKLAEEDFKFAIVHISSHGDEICNLPVVYTSDGMPYYVIDIITLFNNKNLPEFAGKPKIFIIDACRGDKDDGVLVVDGEITSEQKSGSPFSKDKQKKLIATFTNMIVVSSAVSGFASYSRKKGSIFTIALTETIQKYLNVWSIGRIIDRTKEGVRKYSENVGVVQATKVEEYDWMRNDRNMMLIDEPYRKTKQQYSDEDLSKSVENLCELLKTLNSDKMDDQNDTSRAESETSEEK